MRVYLLKTPEYAEDEYNKVCCFLQTFEGPLKFLKVDVDFNEEKFPFLKKFYPGFKFQYLTDFTKNEFDTQRETPLSFCELFSLCEYYRKTFRVDPLDFVVILTNRRNALNWFSSFDKDKNIFVHTSDWDTFTKVHAKYPIAYQVVENILQQLMELEMSVINSEFIHKTAKGCMNDFCMNKEEVLLKMRTANICETCVVRLHHYNIKDEVVAQALHLFEIVRKELIYKKASPQLVTIEPLPLTITRKNQILIEPRNLELKLKPMEKVLYLFYLKQVEGIFLKNMTEHKSELLQIYQKVSASINAQKQEKSINFLVDPYRGSFNIQKSRINKTVHDVLGPDLSIFYKIDGKKGNHFKINLPKHLIQMQH